MSQSRQVSALEAMTNVVLGYGLAVLGQWVIFPGFGIVVSPMDNLRIALAFTILSLTRSYVLRRMFNRLTPQEIRDGTP